MKRGLMLAATAMLTISLVAACSGNKESGGATTAPASGSPKATEPAKTAEPKKDLKLNLATFEYSDTQFNKDWPVWKYISEASGVAITPKSVATNDPKEAYNTIVASKDLPDVMYLTDYDMANRYGSQGALMNVLDYIDKMPNFKKWSEKYPELTRSALSADGKLYIMPNQGNTDGSMAVMMYREDLFKKHNLTPPKTYDDIYTLSKELKKLYPDSYPFSNRNGMVGLDIFFALNFDTKGDVYYSYTNNEWRYGPIEDNYKKMVEFFKKMYDEKLMPPDWLTLDTNAWQKLMSTDKGFITYDYIGRIDLFNEPMQKENPAYKLNWLPPLQGVTGGKTYYRNPVLKNGYGIASNTKNLDAALAFLDFMYSEAGRDLVSWGKKDVDYTETNGVKKMKYANLLEMRKTSGLNTLGSYQWTDPAAVNSMLTDASKKMFADQQPYLEKMQPAPAMTKEELDTLALTGQSIKKAKDENIAKFILGTRPMAEWDAYVQEMKKLGTDKLLDIYKKADDRSKTVKLGK
ncbi:MAG: extracellular solute-binding protein [Paenibacillaceae bacterium]|nr:extracellular solute-binding protein [Paenibacillaceae bacterium]